MIGLCLESNLGKESVSKEQDLMRNIRNGQSMVAEFVVSSNLASAEIEQRTVVNNADQIPQDVTALKLACADELLENTSNKSERESLESFKENIFDQMTLPFTERIKLASILMEQNKLAEAERTLKEATRVELNPNAQSPTIDRLRKYAFTRAFELELSRLMPTFVSSNFNTIDSNNNQFLSRKELNQQLNSQEIHIY